MIYCDFKNIENEKYNSIHPFIQINYYYRVDTRFDGTLLCHIYNQMFFTSAQF